jgi:DtxR family Mn-dependent transcriptional regulator
MTKLTKATERILSEDTLKHIYKCELKKQSPTLQSVAGELQITLDETASLLTNMADHHLLLVQEGTFRLTAEGREYALQVIRAHRLWERYLADETGYAEAEWHDRADRLEHTSSPNEIDALSAQLGHPTYDPHGDPIPTAEGEWVLHGDQPLTTLSVNQPARIVHLEDEPETVYAQLVAEGLAPGMELRLTEITPQRICFLANGQEHVLAPIVAANVSVVPLPKPEAQAELSQMRLADLTMGDSGKVVSISPACRGPERRRLMDLGLLPGTVIKAEMRSPGGDPTAYLIRGALIALRQEQANLIYITHLGETI